MKILTLRFKNLNSLYGEWFIDFTAEDYQEDGIFAITGPTGSGKSTILDAICLALYGVTPRLAKINKNSGNEIMSRQTGDCLAEVKFETVSGIYLVTWAQHRARMKADKKLQDYTHEVSKEGEKGKIKFNSLREVADFIVEITGMDYERFTRSMLLAQGDFATFLKAKPSERSPILEKITGTEIYSKISKKVHVRNSAELKNLAKLNDQLTSMQPLSSEQEKEIKADLETTKQLLKKANEERAELEKNIAWIKLVDSLDKDVLKLSQQNEDIAKERVLFLPKRELFEEAKKCVPLEGDYAKLVTKEEELKKYQKKLTEVTELIPNLEEQTKTLKSRHDAAQVGVIGIRESSKKEFELIKVVRELDVRIDEKKSSLELLNNEVTKVKKAIAKSSTSEEKLVNEVKTQQKDLSKIEKYIQNHQEDSKIANIQEVIKHKLNMFEENTLDKETKENQIKELTVSQENVNDSIKAKELLYDETNSILKEIKKSISSLEDEMSQSLDNREFSEHKKELEYLQKEQFLVQTIVTYEDERKKLTDNQECPLCGSLEHPFAIGNIPELRDIEIKVKAKLLLINGYEEKQADIVNLQSKKDSVWGKVTEIATEMRDLEHSKSDLTKDVKRLKEELGKSDVASLKEEILADLKPYGIKELSRKEIPKINVKLKKKSAKWSKNESRQREITDKITELNNEIKIEQATAIQLNKSYQESSAKYETLKEEFSKMESERKALFADKDCDKEVKSLETELTKCELLEKNSLEQFTIADNKLKNKLTEKAALGKDLVESEKQVDSLLKEFLAKCVTNSLADREEFLSKRMKTEDYRKLEIEVKDLDTKEHTLSTLLKDKKEQLSKEKGKEESDLPLNELENKEKEVSKLVQTSSEKIGKLKEQIATNNKDKEDTLGLRKKIELQKRESDKWAKLHSLIGSADGNRYSNFAQGITFEVMLNYANKQLGKMSDRYRLLRDNNEPLELNIIDSYQAGEIRSTKNLSGGESFIVSLSLALGLSSMASEKIKIDSLFLDEGFGTLDEDALDVALETLTTLKQEGKIIGVISHVEALKERISTQIVITPTSGGRSSVSGPGVKRVVS